MGLDVGPWVSGALTVPLAGLGLCPHVRLIQGGLVIGLPVPEFVGPWLALEQLLTEIYDITLLVIVSAASGLY